MARLVTLIQALTQSYHSTIYATVTYSMVLILGLFTLVASAQQQSPINIDTGATLQNTNLNRLASIISIMIQCLVTLCTQVPP